MSNRSVATLALAVCCGLLLTGDLRAGGQAQERASAGYVPDLSSLGQSTGSTLADLVNRYSADRQAMLRRYDVEISPDHRRALRSFYAEWRTKLATLPFESLGVEERIDAILLNARLGWEVQLLDRRDEGIAQAQPLVPFSAAITALHDAWRRLEPVDPVKAAETLTTLAVDVDRTRAAVEAGLASGAPSPSGPAPVRTSPVVALRAAEQLAELRTALTAWHRHFTGYDPEFTWWTAAPFKRADETLKGYEELLRKKVVGVGADGEQRIVGAPIGREALVADLGFELIPYTPEDLLAIAEREFAWCEAELRKASREMGFGDDWKAALEKVKTLHVAPGRQPDLIRDLAREAEEYVERHGLITVPPLARQVWRVEMMSPERQRVSPFFLGGEVIRVSFPTDTMSHEDKLMSLRGNNAHFARATVFHELIPGHHLQGFMTARYNAHRRAFSTPFWGEGWALYWEMLLWDRGFQRSPEDRVGMLFWRSHRAARIIFSLRFHMGTMTPQECIDFLVDRVGHERANATAEVRRSFNGSYPPLYQLAYMIGGLQFRALHRELVGSGRMSDRQFHDAIITGGSMPVEMVRARLTTQTLARDHRPSWRFAGALEPAPAGR